MMLLPVFERFAEFGWQPFVEPAETFEFFSVSGVFRRANVDASLHGGQPGAQHLVQRSALFDLCLKSGLAHLVVAYVRVEETQPDGAFSGVKNYVLKEPIAVQQWARRRLEAVEQDVNEMISEQQYSGRESPQSAKTEAVEEELRQLNGLRMILIALTERLKDGSRQAAYSSSGVDAEGNVRGETELARLTAAGIQNLLQLLARTQSVACACNCMLWLDENGVAANSEMYNAFYSQARSLRVTYREQFEEVYGTNLSSVSGLKEPMLLIEHVMKSASVSLENLGGSCPPTQLGQLLELLRTPSIQEDVVRFYGDEVDREPIEGYFRVQVALLLYFCLDRAYLSVWKQHTQSGARIAKKMRSLADSLAAQLNVRDDMKLTLLALWLVENAVVIKTSGDDQVGAIYESAINLLQQSSAMHLHQKYDLEADLILHLLETLVHRGESLVAWKVWNTFGVELEQSAPAATELVVVISLELDLWERALSLIRSHKRSDLLGLLFNWLMKSHRLKELVQGVTLLPTEEKLFHTYMMESNVIEDEDVLRDENIKRVDFLVMYYILRNKYEQAWDVHHEHLAMIREMSRGDTEIAMAALNQPSLRIRASLLSNMCVEPPAKSFPHRSRNSNVRGGQRHQPSKPALLENEEMEDVSDVETSAPTASAVAVPRPSEIHTKKKDFTSIGSSFVSAQTEHSTHFQEMGGAGEFDYSPGIFSSRQGSSVTTRSIEASSPLVAGTKTPTPTKGKGKGKTSGADISIGSIDSSPDFALHALTRPNPIVTTTSSVSRGIARQTLNFGSPPVKSSSVPSTPLQTLVSPLGDRRPLGTPPVRSKINPIFASTSVASPAPKASGSTDDLSLKPRNSDSMTDGSFPAVSQETEAATADIPENQVVQQPTTPPSDSDTPDVMLTPKRYQFVREPSTDSRLEVAHYHSDHPMSPASEELEGMELERIDEEFSTPISRSKGRRKEPASVPVRRNPRRSARHKY
uniref:ELYS-like domain-containing protein n=1 Tax=Phytophthora ramorum TaxID=164328 RepID=H3GBY1_PHYRM